MDSQSCVPGPFSRLLAPEQLTGFVVDRRFELQAVLGHLVQPLQRRFPNHRVSFDERFQNDRSGSDLDVSQCSELRECFVDVGAEEVGVALPGQHDGARFPGIDVGGVDLGILDGVYR